MKPEGDWARIAGMECLLELFVLVGFGAAYLLLDRRAAEAALKRAIESTLPLSRMVL